MPFFLLVVVICQLMSSKHWNSIVIVSYALIPVVATATTMFHHIHIVSQQLRLHILFHHHASVGDKTVLYSICVILGKRMFIKKKPVTHSMTCRLDSHMTIMSETSLLLYKVIYYIVFARWTSSLWHLRIKPEQIGFKRVLPTGRETIEQLVASAYLLLAYLYLFVFLFNIYNN